MEERGRGRRWSLLQGDFGDIVLSWSLDQILDDGFFKNQVKKIPSLFSSIEEYFESFAVPLLEETRSELSSSLYDISKSPSARIVSMEDGPRESQTTFQYYIDVEFPNYHADCGKKNYKARNGDIFILSSNELQAIEDLHRYNVTYCLALVIEVAMDGETEKGFTVKISKNFNVKEEIDSYKYGFFLTNLLTNIRIWKAICFTPTMKNNFRIIKEVLSPRPMTILRCSAGFSKEVDDWLTRLSDKLLSIGLNQSQMDALQAAIHATQCRASHPIELIWGPPGTGKTKTVSAILWAFLHMKCRTLTCAPTNVAVVGVCSRLLQLVKATDNEDKQIGRSSSLADLVLFGNRDRMEIDDELQDVFLDSRVDKLVACFSPTTGWNSRIASMIRLLEDCHFEYDVFLENMNEEKIMTFSEFLRKRFIAVLDPLEDCLKNLWIHTNCISSTTASKMFALLELLGRVRHLLCNEDLSDNELRELFSKENSNISLACRDLSQARFEALCLLRLLQTTLSFPTTAEKDWIRDFCLQNASIIFCTASSSSMLHHVQMDLLRVLVIDEAAQLKECESAIPLRLDGLNHAILVGDECQLPSIVKSQICKDAGFGVSLFERLGSSGHKKHLLNIQYRMHPFISSFPNSKFYRKLILDGPNVKDVNYNKNYEDLLFGSYAFLNAADGREELDDKGNSRRNMVEVAVILHLVQRLFKYWETSSQSLSIGIISPYSSQVNTINDRLGNKYTSCHGFDVRVKSVDGFQGEENDVIILSTVRANNKGNIGFLKDHQRANVALTRARHCLWLVGNANTLSESGTIWAELVHDAETRGCCFNAIDDANLAKTILRVKHELDQLDDLLKPNSMLLSNARWKVLFSDDFKKSFAKLKQVSKMEVLHLLLRLAEGWRSKRKIQGFSDSFELVNIYKVRELYLIWTIDIVKDDRYVQVLKVWDLLPVEQIQRLVSRLDHIFSLYTEVYVEHCKFSYTEGNLEVPMSWNIVREIVRYKALSKAKSIVDKDAGDLNKTLSKSKLSAEEDARQLDKTLLKGKSIVEEEAGHLDLVDGLENSKVSESLILMKFYSLSSGVGRHLLTANDGNEIDIPFELTDEEKEIVRFPLSKFILGRSGTGKTTILTMKLIQKEQLYSIASHGTYEDAGPSNADNRFLLNKNFNLNEGNFLKQVFITVSSKLCSAIRSHTCRLRSFACGGEFSGTTASLFMHDSSELSDFQDIPDNFSGLKQEHYPLVITFRKLLMMLDGTMRRSFLDKYYCQWGVDQDHSGGLKSFALQAIIQSKEVDYDKFAGSYWPHFNEELRKTVDCSTVFTQIISHIKGGIESGRFQTGKLSREDYLLLSEKRVSTISSQAREVIYDIFVAYENQKLLACEYDLSDFVNHLHDQLYYNGYEGDMIDFVYIDEVQDLTMRQIGLLKYVCKNFKEGYTFAGDTAQTIARGIDFRFQDIRSLFYKEFISEVKGGHNENKKDRELRVTDMFHLNQNFRTHAGILSLSQSIMDLLYYYFPMSVDKLIPEFSLIYGEAPVLLESGNDENAILTIFGNSGCTQNSLNGFGSEQVILVRDTEMKEQIFSLVGKQALVLTILECKGLEFQDVLLYNFFGESRFKKWRIIYEYMKKQGVLDPSISRSCPSFEPEQHNILCSELKQLYVAITRTKQRLWICENSDEYSKPMFDYWKKLCLIQVRHLDSSLAQSMKAASSSDDWKQRGIKLFNEKNFELAAMCFEKAGDDFNEKWARAAGLVANAERIIATNSYMTQIALNQAAEIYESIHKPEIAATCYIKMKDFKKAGMTYMEKCGKSRLKEAGECFAAAECWTLAANAYAKGKYFSESLTVCSRGGIYDTGMQIIEQWKEASCSAEHQYKLKRKISSYLENCALHYLELGDMEHIMMFVKAFRADDVLLPFLDVVRHFLNSRNLLDDMLTVEQELGNYLEAANIARIKGDLLLEAELYEKANRFEEATRVLLFHVLMMSLWSSGNNGWPLKKFAEKEKLLMKAKEIAHKSNSFEEYVFLEAEILSDREKTLVDLSRHLAAAQKHQNMRQVIFTSRAVLDAHIHSRPLKFHCQQNSVLDAEKLAHDTMSQNLLTMETMMYIWDLWKAMMLNLLSYLEYPEGTEENGSSYEEFYLEYFGLRKEDKGGAYLLHNPEPSWTKNTAKVSVIRDKNLVRMAASDCISCAKYYWSKELFSVGMNLLHSLESLHVYFVQKNLYPFCRAKVAIWMYEVAKFLTVSQFTFVRSTNETKRYLHSSKLYYFDAVFPLDWEDDTIENVKFVHDNKVDMDLVEGSLDENLIPSNGNLTHGQIGRLVMLLLLKGRLSDEWFKKTIDSLNNAEPWREFVIQYGTFLDMGFAKIPVITKFESALRSTFAVNWIREKDYLSPHFFIYLVEILLFFASSCQGLGGQFFTTKSSLLQILKCHGCKGYMDTCLSVLPVQSDIRTSMEYIITTCKNILRERNQMSAWISNSRLPMAVKSILTLRLVIILYLAYLNAEKNIYELRRFLLKLQIFQDLPRTFSNRLQHADINRAHFIPLFAESLAVVKNPLVIVYSQKRGSRISLLNALSINSEEMRCREKVFDILFPKKKFIQEKKSERESIGKSLEGIHSNGRSQEIVSTPSPILVEKVQGSELGQKDIEKESTEQYEPILQKLEEFLSGKHDDVEIAINRLETSLDWMKQKVDLKNLGESLITEMQNMHMELKLHAKMRSEGAERYPTKAGLHAKWKGLRTSLQPLMDTLCSRIQETTTEEASWSDKVNDDKDHQHAKLKETSLELTIDPETSGEVSSGEKDSDDNDHRHAKLNESPVNHQHSKFKETNFEPTMDPETSGEVSWGEKDSDDNDHHAKVKESPMNTLSSQVQETNEEASLSDVDDYDSDQNIVEAQDLPDASSSVQNNVGKGTQNKAKKKQKKSRKKGKNKSKKK
ncbi:hypothetical protein Cni_G14601 [Canna indica]|uniref:UvrD-like helicase ATP-binding domain-containing protein n=1 Tax=Canna indica TaxID=4628 RepID=A0AAQ3KEH2_9LILI|nr:hypothetical protein Cni_G14601 [Canna indica]